MKIYGRTLMSICSMAVSAWVVITALKWPLMAALFPTVIGIPVFFMALSEFYLCLSKKETNEKEESGVDFKLSEVIDQALANRQTISIFLWLIGFFLLIVLVGFSVAIPIFFILFLKLKGKKGWKISLGIGALAWACFFALFIWLLHIPFWGGWVQKWLRAFGIV